MEKVLVALALVAVTAPGCCYSPGGATSTPPPVGGPVIGGGGPVIGGGSGAPVTLAPGFSPDPMLMSGAGGGPREASTINPACRGWIGMTPSHSITAAGAFPNLRILVASETDMTLVVQMADGSYRCNDDTDGFNPVVEGPFPPGVHHVYVGTYGQGMPGAYQIGFTVNPGVTPSTMNAPPPPVAAGGGAPGAVLRQGTATVLAMMGNVPGVATGTVCTYVQMAAPPTSGFDCRWQVTCAGQVVYGAGEGGFNPCTDANWPPGALAADMNTTSGDQDPSFVFMPGSMTIRDDASGTYGAIAITLNPSM